jgi:hypothetical protein
MLVDGRESELLANHKGKPAIGTLKINKTGALFSDDDDDDDGNANGVLPKCAIV